jgi:hypothetical protein
MLAVATALHGVDALQGRLRFRLLRPLLELDVVRNRNRCEQANDCDNNHQLDEREALGPISAILHLLPLFTACARDVYIREE